MALADQMSFSANGDFGISDAGLCDYLLNDLDDDPASTDAIYAAFFFESLQQQVNEVERENALLKELVRTNPLLAATAPVLSTHDALPAVATENRSRATDLLNASDFTLMQTLQSAQRSFCITDPSLKDNPIAYGPGTFPGTVAELAKGIAEGTDTTVTILNYKKDGTPFWNQLVARSATSTSASSTTSGSRSPSPGPAQARRRAGALPAKEAKDAPKADGS
ncbi:hypothetical protein JL722_12890 [Aureococcus anophagefferens]|nr:hypothetical protein JL722_12890 [Aureococcus anophagefferens]